MIENYRDNQEWSNDTHNTVSLEVESWDDDVTKQFNEAFIKEFGATTEVTFWISW